MHAAHGCRRKAPGGLQEDCCLTTTTSTYFSRNLVIIEEVADCRAHEFRSTAVVEPRLRSSPGFVSFPVPGPEVFGVSSIFPVVEVLPVCEPDPSPVFMGVHLVEVFEFLSM